MSPVRSIIRVGLTASILLVAASGCETTDAGSYTGRDRMPLPWDVASSPPSWPADGTGGPNPAAAAADGPAASAVAADERATTDLDPDAEAEADAAAADEPEPAGPPPMTAEDAIAAGLQIIELAAGDRGGPTVGPRSSVVLRMVGRILNGPVILETDAEAGPWPVDRFVEGLTAGLQGMAVGDRRRLIIPPAMAYGDQPVADPAARAAGGRPLIPAGSPLVYEVELLELRDGIDPPATDPVAAEPPAPGAPAPDTDDPDGGAA